MLERFLIDVLEIALWSRAAHPSAQAAREQLALPSPAALQRSFQIPHRGHYELNATQHQKHQLELMGATNFQAIDALGRDQAKYLIEFCTALQLSQQQENARLAQLEREEERRRQRNSTALVVLAFLVACIIVFGIIILVGSRESTPPAPEAGKSSAVKAGSSPSLIPPRAVATPQHLVPAFTPASRAFLTDVALSQRIAVERHPELSIKGSALNTRFLARLNAWKLRHDPRMDRSDWPEKLADDCTAHP